MFYYRVRIALIQLMRLLLLLIASYFSLPSNATAQERWIRLDSVTEQQLVSVQFIDANRGYVLGRQASFFTTSDGGRSWSESHITYDHIFAYVELFDMHFHDALTGVAAGSVDTTNGLVAAPRATLFWTYDGGKTWEPQMLDEPGAIRFLKFFDRKLAYFVASQNEVVDTSSLYFTDAGGFKTEHWNKITAFPSPSKIQGMAWKDNATGIITGEEDLAVPNNLYLTENSGETWSTFVGDQNGSTISLGAVHWNDDGLLATSGSRILFSLDKGHTWGVVASTAGSAFYNGFAFADNMIGFAVPMFSGQVLKATNGGYAWEVQQLPEFAMIHDLWPVTEQIAYAVGAQGKMFKLTAQSSVGHTPSVATKLSVYPDPARNFAHVESIASDHDRVGRVFDRLGREVLTFDLGRHGEAQLDLRSLPTGAYSVVVDGQATSLIIARSR